MRMIGRGSGFSWGTLGAGFAFGALAAGLFSTISTSKEDSSTYRLVDSRTYSIRAVQRDISPEESPLRWRLTLMRVKLSDDRARLPPRRSRLFALGDDECLRLFVLTAGDLPCARRGDATRLRTTYSPTSLSPTMRPVVHQGFESNRLFGRHLEHSPMIGRPPGKTGLARWKRRERYRPHLWQKCIFIRVVRFVSIASSLEEEEGEVLWPSRYTQDSVRWALLFAVPLLLVFELDSSSSLPSVLGEDCRHLPVLVNRAVACRALGFAGGLCVLLGGYSPGVVHCGGPQAGYRQ